MNHYAAWKNILVVFFLFITSLYALPNIYGSDLAIQITGTGDYAVEENDLEVINKALVENAIDFKSLELINSNILIRFSDSKSQLSSKALLKDTLSRNYVVALNLAPSIPQWLSGLGGKAMSLGLDLRGYTDLGYLFNVEQSIDMQCISAVYSIDAVKDICFDSYFGLSTTLQSNSKFHSLFLSERMRVRLYENLWFSVELTQHSNAVVKDRIQPILHSGFLLSL